ncbi:G-protein coupled receptor GRL101, partial [Stylophora pistillata]
RYLYIEASSRQNGDNARLRSGWFINAPELCLQFWYHMYGKDIGTLNIYIEAVNSEKKVWSQQGDQGDKWIFAQVPVNLGEHQRQFQILFKGTLESAEVIFLGIDDISFSKEKCNAIPNDGQNDKCLWTTESGQCCAFPFEYNDKTYSSCITTPEKPRPWCATSMYYVIEGVEYWDFCKGVGRLIVRCPDVKNATKEDALGSISDLNLWDGVLDEEEIQRMSLGCERRDGDLKAWRSMRSGVIGDAHVHYDTSSCRDVTACRELSTDKSGYIVSPYYPGYYANESWCEWRITAPIGLVIRLEFLYFHLEATEPQCLNDYVEVFDGNSTYSTSLGRFCGHTYPAMLESSFNNLLVVFKSDNKGVRTGFKVYYEMRKECPLGCACYMVKGPPPHYVLEGAEYMESIPRNIPGLTTVLLFAGSKITRLTNGDFYSLSSLTYIDLGHNKIFQVESGTFEVVWLLGFVMSFLPMSGLSYFNVEGKGNGFYGRSTVCLALQLSNDRPPGWEYSVSIFIGFNLLAFLFISCSYVAIFLSAVKSSSSIRSTNVKRESTLAKRVAFIILTDFCCWMPVIIIGILSLSGSFHDPEKKAYVWMAVFVLPFNSSVNPILYTLSTPQMRDWFCKHSKSKEHGKRGVHYLRKPGALLSATASNPATKITTTELSLPSLNVANLERSGCINKGFQDDTSPPENGNRLALVENGSSQDNSSATYDTRL